MPEPDWKSLAARRQHEITVRLGDELLPWCLAIWLAYLTGHWLVLAGLFVLTWAINLLGHWLVVRWAVWIAHRRWHRDHGGP